MSSSATLPIATKATTQDLAKAAASPAKDSVFQLLYFPLNGRGELIRNLLAYGAENWEELPVDWPTQKPQVPFQVAPVLYERTSVTVEVDGSPVPVVLEIAESQAIERYLGQKFNLLGGNVWEEHLVNRYFHSTDVLLQAFAQQIVGAAPEARVEAATKFYAETLAKWIQIHEGHLKANGDKGHYVGQGVTLADIKTALVIDRILFFVPKGLENPFSATLTPGLWKVKEQVDSKASLAAWKASERYSQLNSNTKARFGF